MVYSTHGDGNLLCMPIIQFPWRLHVSMTTEYCLKKPQTIFFITTSSLLKLANCRMHEGETWCACVLHCFHDNHNNKEPQAFVFKITSSLLKLANSIHHTWRWNLVHMRITSFPWQLHVSMTTTYCSNSFRHFSSNLLTVARMEMKLGTQYAYWQQFSLL